MSFKKIGIVGFGQMGAGIAQVTAAAGYKVVAREEKEELLQKGLKGIEKLLDKAIEKGNRLPVQGSDTGCAVALLIAAVIGGLMLLVAMSK